MSNAKKIGTNKGKINVSDKKISQSIPANFWSGRNAPQAPVIRPQVKPNGNNVLPKMTELPPINDKTHGMDEARKGGSFSLKLNKHPMSLPVKSTGFMFPQYNPKKEDIIDEKDNLMDDDTDPNSLEKDISKMKVGSLTLYDIMGGKKPLQPIIDEEHNESGSLNINKKITNDNNDENNKPNIEQDIDDDENPEPDDTLYHIDDDENTLYDLDD